MPILFNLWQYDSSSILLVDLSCSRSSHSQVVLAGTQSLNIPLPAHLEVLARFVLQLDAESTNEGIPGGESTAVARTRDARWQKEAAEAMDELWRDAVVRLLVERGNELQLNDSAV